MTVEYISSADSKTGQSSGRLASLDWLRGIASLWVLFYHIDITMQKEKYFAVACFLSGKAEAGQLAELSWPATAGFASCSAVRV
ncbi:hypothetical protein [Sphingorhabdus sp.]|uniref:hypothetical protein n=1 Tax=Sphingorhabdus sp. TaxID=1902408 RepID=UPI00391D6CC9